MKPRYIILLSFLLLSLHCSADVVWFNGSSPVSYTLMSHKTPVVELALQMFSEDMHQVTGHKAVHSSDGTIQVYELDKMKDKEFRKLTRRKLPIDKIIAKRDAYYVGVESGKIVVMGSNDYGTAYGILELSRLAGVSPWVWWGDAVPKRRRYLGMKENYYTVQWPSVSHRGFHVTGPEVSKKETLMLLLRLRGNTLEESEVEGSRTLVLPEKWLPSTQPGYVFHELRGSYAQGAVNTCVARVYSPRVVPYQLQLFMDMAWNMDYVSADKVQEHYRQWLSQIFGDELAVRLLPIMTQYYFLTGVRKPEQMDVEFAADAFGNEQERYINNWKRLSESLDKVSPLIPESLKDAFFSHIQYPVQAGALMAEKQLQALEARHIGRPQSFHHDEEALYSAVRSWKAYEALNRLNDYYNTQLADGRWHNILPLSDKLIGGAPELPDKLTKKELKDFAKPEPIYFNFDTENTITRNAIHYRKASVGCQAVEMLGHSMKAVALPQGGELQYSFYSELKGEAVIRVAAIPTQVPSDARFSVCIDNNTPQIFSAKSQEGSEAWKTDSERGQAVREVRVELTRNSHSIVVKALDPGVAIDQIMVDYDPERVYYMFPVNPEDL